MILGFCGKIPEESTNDSEQLRITLAKCKRKRTLQDEVGGVGALGIPEYERRQTSGHAVDFNVNMNLSPEKNNDTKVTQKQSTKGDFSETKNMRSEEDTKAKREKTRKQKPLFYASQASDSEPTSSSSDSSRSSCSDHSKRRKQPLKVSHLTKKKHLSYDEHPHSVSTAAAEDR